MLCKSMFQKNNHDLRKNIFMLVWVHLYPCVLQIYSSKNFLFSSGVLEYKKTNNDIDFSKELNKVDNSTIGAENFILLNWPKM